MIHLQIQQRLQQTVVAVLPGVDTASVLVRPCPDPKFGEYQSNALMAIAKERKMNPRQLATEVAARLDVSDWCEKVDIAGPGFLNFRVKPSALAAALDAAAQGGPLFFQKADRPRSVVVDFSSPNVAKPMHVGHIRSTILGDCLARTLRLLGHRVVTDNHIGDWGTQFGMLLIGWKTLLDLAALQRDAIAELELIYKAVQLIESKIRTETKVSIKEQFQAQIRKDLAEGLPEDKIVKRIHDKFSNSPIELSSTAVESRKELVKLQSGDAENLAIWHEMIRLSQVQFDAIYGRLGVKFDHTLGESFYNPWLADLVADLVAKGIARESEGAIGVFSDGTLPPKDDPFLISRDGEWTANPALIKKTDGGYNYATTDLATLQHRIETWQPSEIIYVTDGRQQLHFQQVFQTFRRWQPKLAGEVKLAHVWFGSILGDDGKPFKTRSGETVKLSGLLDEAEERAFQVVTAKNPDLPEAQRREIARVVGLGAVKYADLLPNRQSDYIFSWDKMLALQGNTAPYLLYAYTRTRSLARKAAESGVAVVAGGIRLRVPEEIALARQLINFGIVLEAVVDDYRPNYLCNYLYELAGALSRFWENCPALKADEPERSSRLQLTELTGRVLRQGLEVLGIEVLEQM